MRNVIQPKMVREPWNAVDRIENTRLALMNVFQVGELICGLSLLVLCLTLSREIFLLIFSFSPTGRLSAEIARGRNKEAWWLVSKRVTKRNQAPICQPRAISTEEVRLNTLLWLLLLAMTVRVFILIPKNNSFELLVLLEFYAFP